MILRPVTEKDASVLWTWRNDPTAYAHYFHPTTVTWETHLVWLRERLTDPSVRIWIAEVPPETKVGVVRFEPTGNPDEMRIGVSLDASCRGRGLGTRLIREGTERLFRETDCIRVRAEVFRSNSTSGAAFRSAGYVPADDDPAQPWFALVRTRG